jgi:replicative DNA helicase
MNVLNTEAALLSAIIAEPEILASVTEMLRPSDFSNQQHRQLYQYLCQLYENGQGIDLITILNKYKTQKEKIWLNELSDMVLTAVNYKEYMQQIKENSQRKQLAKIIQTMNYELESGTDLNAIINDNQNRMLDLTSQEAATLLTGQQAIKKALLEKEKYKAGIKTGIFELDKIITFKPQNLVTIAAFSGVGKTVLANQIGFSQIEAGKIGIFFNLEMSSTELIEREEMRSGCLDDLYDMKFYIDTKAGMDISHILSTARKIKYQEGKLDFIIVDYVGLITVMGIENREQQIAYCSRMLKSVARQLDTVVFMLSQLNDDGKLRGSRAKEQDSDIVIKVDRPGYRQQKKVTTFGSKIDIDETYITVTKNRGGKTGKISARFDGEHQQFTGL